MLNFVIDEKWIGIITDSVVSSSLDMTPAFFTNKVFIAPHWNGAICGTGLLSVISEWALTSMSNILAKDIVDLDEYTPSHLKFIFENHTRSAPINCSVTIYHFGYSQRDKRFIGFAYRSETNFQSERLENGIGWKPNPEISSNQLQVSNFPDDFIRISQIQKEKDTKKNPQNRVGIGGQLFSYIITMDDEKFSARVNCIYEFSDFDADYQTALLNQKKK